MNVPKGYSKSVLSPETDALITRIIGCAIRVHSELGPGFLEAIYTGALEVEFEHSKIAFEREKPIVVRYRDRAIACQRLDFVVEDRVILEIKAALRLEPVFQAVRRFEYSNSKSVSEFASTTATITIALRFETQSACRRVEQIPVSSERYFRRYTTVV